MTQALAAPVNIALELFGAVITLLLLLRCLAEDGAEKNDARRSRQSRLFSLMLLANLTTLLCDAATWALSGRAEHTFALYALNALVYALGYLMAALFSSYICCYMQLRRSVERRFTAVVHAVCALAAALVAVSLYNKMYFSYEDGVYARGPLFAMSQLVPAAVMLADIALILACRKKLGRRDAASLLSYGALPVAAIFAQLFVYGVTLLYVATTLSMLIIYLMLYAERSKRLMERELELSHASVSIMLSQIQPHFLYNALGTIEELCHSDPPSAERAVQSFTRFLKGNLDSLSSVKPIEFEQELSHTTNYLAIEKLRFGNRLNIDYDLRATQFTLPTLTLQPIVENAVRYGVTKRVKGGTVTISSAETEDEYIVTVADDGVGFDPELKQEDGRTHIGIANVRERLERICGGTLTIKSTSGVGTVAVIRLPKKHTDEKSPRTKERS